MPLQATQAERQMASVSLATGVTLNYVEQGDERGDAVILLHGWPDSWHSYALVLPLLNPRHHVFALDQRGHGNSSKPACCYTMHHFAADVIAFLDAHRIDRATVVGHSMGSVIAQLVAIHFPSRVSRLVLIGATPRAKNQITDEVGAAVQPLTDPIDPEFVREFQMSTLYGAAPAEFMELIISESLKAPAHVWRQAFDGVLQEETTTSLAKIGAPTLILWGDQDGLFPRSDQETLISLLPKATLLVYEQAGHSLQWEQSERVAADLERFLAGSKL
ncbi:MAG TPA: alpha/beta hydrolase [Caldilineaceae bacterium]|nr:alpha/beta hydrolase [Caldilineaceae bacterium]